MKSLQLIGMKHTGKSTLGRLIAGRFGKSFFDLDDLLEVQFDPNKSLTCREIHKKFGSVEFQRYETAAAQSIFDRLDRGEVVLAWGGGTVSNAQALQVLSGAGTIVHLREDARVLFDRIMRGGLPSFLSAESPWEDFQKLYETRTQAMENVAHVTVNLHGLDVERALKKVLAALEESHLQN